MVTRVVRLLDPHHLHKAISHLSNALLANGYARNQINKPFDSRLHPKPKCLEPNSPTQSLISLHYIHDIIDRISIFFIGNDIKTVSKPHILNNYSEGSKTSPTLFSPKESTKFFVPTKNLYWTNW